MQAFHHAGIQIIVQVRRHRSVYRATARPPSAVSCMPFVLLCLRAVKRSIVRLARHARVVRDLAACSLPLRPRRPRHAAWPMRRRIGSCGASRPQALPTRREGTWRVQVEYCFTVEGDDTHLRIVGMRGLDAPLYYRPDSLLNLAHPSVQGLVLDSPRHWATEFHLDGFCLLSAESPAQDGSGTVLDCPTIAQAILQDLVLRGCKMVAWPRDA